MLASIMSGMSSQTESGFNYPPFRLVYGFYLWRGQRLSGGFSLNTTTNFYIMDRMNFQYYNESYSFTSFVSYLNISRGTFQTFSFESPKSGQYFIVIETEPISGGIIGYDFSFTVAGLNMDFLQAGVGIVSIGFILFFSRLIQKLKQKGE